MGWLGGGRVVMRMKKRKRPVESFGSFFLCILHFAWDYSLLMKGFFHFSSLTCCSLVFLLPSISVIHPSISVSNISLFLSLFLFRVLGYFASHLQQSNVPPMCFLPRVSPSHTLSTMLARLQTLSSNLSNNLCARIPLNLVVHNCIRSIQSIQSHPHTCMI